MIWYLNAINHSGTVVDKYTTAQTLMAYAFCHNVFTCFVSFSRQTRIISINTMYRSVSICPRTVSVVKGAEIDRLCH